MLDRILVFGAPMEGGWLQPGSHERVIVLDLVPDMGVKEQFTDWCRSHQEDPTQYKRAEGTNCWFRTRKVGKSKLPFEMNGTVSDLLRIGLPNYKGVISLRKPKDKDK